MCIMNWTRLSNHLDKSVQFVGHVCPIRWTRLSNLLDTSVQFAGHICPISYDKVRKRDRPIRRVGRITLPFPPLLQSDLHELGFYFVILQAITMHV